MLHINGGARICRKSNKKAISLLLGRFFESLGSMKLLRQRAALCIVFSALVSQSLCSPTHFARGNPASSTNVTILPLTNFGNQAYAVPISINGLEFLAQPDLGRYARALSFCDYWKSEILWRHILLYCISTDLVAFAEAQVPNATNLTIPVADVFGQGEAIGVSCFSTTFL